MNTFLNTELKFKYLIYIFIKMMNAYYNRNSVNHDDCNISVHRSLMFSVCLE